MKKILILIIALLGTQFHTYSQIHISIEVDQNFKKTTILLTNRFADEVVLSTCSPLFANNRNAGIKVDFRDSSNVLSTWTYPFQVVGKKFYSAFPIPSQETILIELNLLDFSRKLKDELKSIEVSIGFLIVNPTTNERYKVRESFVLNGNDNKRNGDMILHPITQQ